MIIKFNKGSYDLETIFAGILYNEGEPNLDSIELLQEKGVLIGGHLSKAFLAKIDYKITEETDTNQLNDIQFEEFLNAYPEFDNLRPLHDVSDKVKAKYLKKINNDPSLHNEVLGAIQREIRSREIRLARGEFIESWKSLSKYVETEGWNRYLRDLPETPMPKSYGEDEL